VPRLSEILITRSLHAMDSGGRELHRPWKGVLHAGPSYAIVSNKLMLPFVIGMAVPSRECLLKVAFVAVQGSRSTGLPS